MATASIKRVEMFFSFLTNFKICKKRKEHLHNCASNTIPYHTKMVKSGLHAIYTVYNKFIKYYVKNSVIG